MSTTATTKKRPARLKLVNNTWVAFAAEAAVSSVALARRLGLDTEKVMEALAGSPLVSAWQAAKLQRIAKDDFSAQFALSLALKDVRLALQAAGAPLRAWLTNGAGSRSRAWRPGPYCGEARTPATRRIAIT